MALEEDFEESRGFSPIRLPPLIAASKRIGFDRESFFYDKCCSGDKKDMKISARLLVFNTKEGEDDGPQPYIPPPQPHAKRSRHRWKAPVDSNFETVLPLFLADRPPGFAPHVIRRDSKARGAQTVRWGRRERGRKDARNIS